MEDCLTVARKAGALCFVHILTRHLDMTDQDITDPGAAPKAPAPPSQTAVPAAAPRPAGSGGILAYLKRQKEIIATVMFFLAAITFAQMNFATQQSLTETQCLLRLQVELAKEELFQRERARTAAMLQDEALILAKANHSLNDHERQLSAFLELNAKIEVENVEQALERISAIGGEMASCAM
jgi:hypothetical protein